MTTAASESELTLFETLVHQRSGIVLRTRRGDLAKRVAHMIEELHLPSARALYDLMQAPARGRELQDKLIEALTVSETHFFRNKPQVDALEQHILPELIRRNRESRSLRIWSAGCATGEEPYTIAILLHHLLPDLVNWRIELLASDLNSSSLQKAHEGLYGDWSFRQIPAHYKDKYFTVENGKFRIVPHILRMVRFARINLVEAASGPQTMFDLILCRNVFIYFDEATTEKVVTHFHGSLTDDGWLIVGHAEPSQKIYQAFTVREFPGAVLYQKSKNIEAAADHGIWTTPTPVAWAPLPGNAADAVLFKPAMSLELELQPQALSPLTAPVPECPPVLNEIEAMIAAKRHGDALHALESVCHAHPKFARAHYLMARLHAQQTHWRAAAAAAQHAVELTPLDAPAHYLLGLIHQEEGAFADAVNSFRHCAFLDPEHALAHYLMAVCLCKQGVERRAAKSMDRAATALQGLPPEVAVRDGDGLTVGQLLGWIAEWRAHDGTRAQSN